MMNEKLTVRNTTTFDFEDLTSESILHPEKVMIRLNIEGAMNPIDIGVLCFSKRERSSPALGPSQHGKPLRVDLRAFKPERRALLNAVFDILLLTNRKLTALDFINVIRNFVNWADDNDQSRFMESRKYFRQAYSSFVEYLREEISKGKLSPSTCNARQRILIRLIDNIFNSEDAQFIKFSISIIKSKRNSKDPRTESDVDFYLDIIYNLATQISELLLNENDFPFEISFKEYSTRIFPSNGKNFKTPYVQDINKVYSSDDGSLVTLDTNYESLRSAQKTLSNNNLDKRSFFRMHLASIAVKAYAALFMMLTGCNNSVFIALEHSEALDLVNDGHKKELTGVKFRANGREVKLPIGGNKGIKLLKRYLNFREWVLGDIDFKYLFFNFAYSGSIIVDKPIQLKTDFQSKLFIKILKGKFLPDNFKNVTPTETRKYKSLILHKIGVSPTIISKIMGHSVGTNLSRYAEPTKEMMSDEMGLLFTSIRKASELISTKNDNDKSILHNITTGHCKSYGAHEAESDSVPIKPKCLSPTGCFFCKHYMCHADTEDVHKILSVRYVMLEVKMQSENTNHADRILTPLINRIDEIIESISERSDKHKAIVNEVDNQVNNLGILTPFWESRLRHYEELGVLQ